MAGQIFDSYPWKYQKTTVIKNAFASLVALLMISSNPDISWSDGKGGSTKTYGAYKANI